MSITLDQSQSGPPGVKLRNVGDHVDICVVSIESRDATDVQTGEVRINPTTGKAKKEEVVTALVIGGTGVITVGDEDVVPDANLLVRIFLSGARLKSWIDAKAELRKASGEALTVGDAARLRFAREEPASVRGYHPVKVWEIKLRKPKPEEAALVKAAEAAYHELQAPTQRTPLPDTSPAASAAWDDEDPF